jgi:hypothetical protein
MVFICLLYWKYEIHSFALSIFGEQGLKETLTYKIKLSLDISISNIVFIVLNWNYVLRVFHLNA